MLTMARLPLILLLLFYEVHTLKISFTPNETITIHMDEVTATEYEIIEVGESDAQNEFVIYSENNNVATLDLDRVIVNPQINSGGFLNVTGIFLGQTRISCRNFHTDEIAEESLGVIVIRKQRVIDKVFTASVATLVCIIYVNFACALNWGELPKILKKPIGPIIGFSGQFIFMPLLSYGLGLLLFPGNAEMQLGMFFTGVAPGGGASNVWTVLLDGNMSLSIIMSAVSTIAAFGMIPLWVFTLGKVIFNSGNLEVPYSQISISVFSLLVPLAIGYLIQRYCKKIAQFMTRILKIFSTCLILFIIIFAIVTNLYLFQLFSWQIVVAGMGLPWFGFLYGFLIGLLLRQPITDCIAISVETGIQNTGISIFLLRFALPQPQADLTTIAPVSVAILTPFPLLFIFIIKKVKARFFLSKSEKKVIEDSERNSNVSNIDDESNESKVTTIEEKINCKT